MPCRRVEYFELGIQGDSEKLKQSTTSNPHHSAANTQSKIKEQNCILHPLGGIEWTCLENPNQYVEMYQGRDGFTERPAEQIDGV